ncbi:hypothetical protein C8E03_101869 [Lachnotalea glycerini]|jgi:hypothetical protein|uniref:Flagellar operon protein (TIGR03826 family) n=1 Tax=Lachnotalea glycerini TaxID=1763509 RepID=A0A255IG03_9FIRM|nr:hypothetical protein [Lachnotalea glycerini]PXV96234.1 hypothetical protein C8E03_101869 [Lachnotalea glycerini]RDY31077.1 hypothetical protein CG710_011375 [Lachnotalea glycerini]
MADIRIEYRADPARCPICGADYRQVIPELVKCVKCGFEEKSVFGIIKEYIDKNGVTTMSDVAKGCKLPIRKVDYYLRSGQLEIPENSEIFIKCRRCGIDIRYGKYCRECALILLKDITNSFEIKESEIGEVPRKMEGKMRFINKE